MKKDKPTREQFERTLAAVKAGRANTIPPDEVTGVIDCALERLQQAAEEQHQAVLKAIEENERESRNVSSTFPPPGSGDRRTDSDD